jgi:uncharacterized membrane protein
LIAFAVAYVFLRAVEARSWSIGVVFGVLWLLLLPNTAYLFTDVGHLTYRWEHTGPTAARALLVTRYVLLELFACLILTVSFVPQVAAVLVRARLSRGWETGCWIAVDLLVGFGAVLGRYAHINSNVAVTHPELTIRSAGELLVSPDRLVEAVLIAVACGVLHLSVRRTMQSHRRLA